MFRVGPGEIILILLIVLLLFGASRLPEIARAIGKSVKEFKKGLKEVNDDIKESGKDDNKAG
jgi:sec-independent protein translocase protein TatA